MVYLFCLDTATSRAPWTGGGIIGLFRIALGFWIGLLVLPFMAIVARLARWLLGDDLVKRLLEQPIHEQTADLPTGNYLFLRCSGDEAAAALSAAQFIAWVGAIASRRIAQFVDSLLASRKSFPKRILLRILTLALILSCVTIAFQSISLIPTAFNMVLHPSEDFFIDLMVAAVFLIGTVLLFAFAATIAGMLLIILTQAITTWAFGWTGFAAGFLVELAIEPLPFGAHILVHIDWHSALPDRGGLAHSLTYAHPVAIQYLKDWIVSRLDRSLSPTIQ
jgi:hypothetical protein